MRLRRLPFRIVVGQLHSGHAGPFIAILGRRLVVLDAAELEIEAVVVAVVDMVGELGRRKLYRGRYYWA